MSVKRLVSTIFRECVTPPHTINAPLGESDCIRRFVAQRTGSCTIASDSTRVAESPLDIVQEVDARTVPANTKLEPHIMNLAGEATNSVRESGSIGHKAASVRIAKVLSPAVLQARSEPNI